MDNLSKLVQHCKCGVYVTVNAHRDNYQTAQQYFDDLKVVSGHDLDIPAEVLAVMVETNTIVNIHFYPRTPIGFDEVYHYDLETALQMAVDMLEP